jgi:hypothetical protein
MASEEQDMRNACGFGVAEAGAAPRRNVAQHMDTARQSKITRFIADSLQFHGSACREITCAKRVATNLTLRP